MITVFSKLPDSTFIGLIEVAMAYRERLSQSFIDEWDARAEHIELYATEKGTLKSRHIMSGVVR